MVMIELVQDAPTDGYYQDIWHTAVVIDAMCVRRGLAGRGLVPMQAHFGMLCRLILEIVGCMAH